MMHFFHKNLFSFRILFPRFRIIVASLQVPRYEDIYEEDSDDEDGPNRKRRREEEDEEENSLLPRKERWKRKREELLFTYYELSGI